MGAVSTGSTPRYKICDFLRWDTQRTERKQPFRRHGFKEQASTKATTTPCVFCIRQDNWCVTIDIIVKKSRDKEVAEGPELSQ